MSTLPALPRLPRATKSAKSCACGCGGSTRGGRFVPGHDARLHGIIKRVERGVMSLEDVRDLCGGGVLAAVRAARPDWVVPTVESEAA
jgi:hypothetical protein